MNESAREVAVLFWRAQLAAEIARFEVLDARVQKGQGAMSDAAWSALLDLHLEAQTAVQTARGKHADAVLDFAVPRTDGDPDSPGRHIS